MPWPTWPAWPTTILHTYLAASGWLDSINQYGVSGRKNIEIVVKKGVIIEMYEVTFHGQ